MNIDLYVNKSQNNVVNKDITLIQTLTNTHLKKNVSNINLEIVVSYDTDFDKCNYIYIPHFKRYYYITDITYSQQCIIISAKCDVLMSFKSQILQSEQIVIAQEKKGDMYLESATWEEDARQYIRNIYFDEDHFNHTQDCYLLAVLS
jgi:hypothetical protein